MNTILQDIIEHHIWANDTLLAFCEALTAEQLTLTVPGTFGGIEDTLVHLAANEEHYLALIDSSGVPTGVGYTIFSDEVPRKLGSVRPVLSKTAEALRDLVRKTADNQLLTGTWDGETFQLPLSVLITQVVDHGTEHRTHIRTILAAHGIARDVDEGTTEPNIDGWAWNDAREAVS